MIVTNETRETVASHHTSCSHEQCQKQSEEIGAKLLAALASDLVRSFQPAGTWLLNRRHPRPVYAIERADGRRMRVAFTGMTTLMVFSKRGRFTHCRPDELEQKLARFLNEP